MKDMALADLFTEEQLRLALLNAALPHSLRLEKASERLAALAARLGTAGYIDARCGATGPKDMEQLSSDIRTSLTMQPVTAVVAHLFQFDAPTFWYKFVCGDEMVLSPCGWEYFLAEGGAPSAQLLDGFMVCGFGFSAEGQTEESPGLVVFLNGGLAALEN